MTVLNAVIQGILQGLTEFLPISSSGHLSLFQYFTGQNETSGLMFSIFLHMGTLLAVFLAFYKTVIALFKEFVSMVKDLVKVRSSVELKNFFKKANDYRRMIFLLVVSLIPMIISVYLMDMFTKISTDNDIIVEGGCFIITSILLFLSDSCIKGNKTAANMKYKDAVAIGVMQAVAPFPGISRSGSTISIGLIAGLDREFAVAFSFLMGIFPVLGANVMEFANASDKGLGMPVSIVLIGIATSLVVGLLAIKMVKWLVTSEGFRLFAYYTLVLGVLTVGVGIFERLSNHMIRDLIISMMPMMENVGASGILPH